MVVFAETTWALRTKVDEGPTEEMIAERTAEIRQRWSPRVRRRRRVDGSDEVRVTQMPLVPRRKGTWDD